MGEICCGVVAGRPLAPQMSDQGLGETLGQEWELIERDIPTQPCLAKQWPRQFLSPLLDLSGQGREWRETRETTRANR